MGTLGREGSLPLRQHHTGAGVKSCCCPTPNAGLAPSAALIEEILSQTEQASVCLRLTYPPGGSAGGENPHKPQSPWQGGVGWGHRLGLELPNLLSSQETRLSKARICPGWSQQLLMDLLGQALGSEPAQSCRGGGSWHRLFPGCEGGERGLCASCKSQVPALVSQSKRDLDLMAPWSILEQAGKGVLAPPLWQPCLFKAPFKTSQTAEGG